MSFSTKNNPKLAQSGVALTSLGAVGGARGTAAGGLRILVEFLTTYDENAIKDLESDLEDIETKSKLLASEDEARQKKLAAVRKQLHNVDLNLRSRADAATRKEIRLQDSLQGTRTKTGKAALAASERNLQSLLKAQGFTRHEITDITNRYNLRKQEAVLVDRIATAEEKAQARARQAANTQGQLTKIQQVRANLVPKLSGLAIGAIGGIFGGAVLGLGFAAAEKGLELVGDKIQDLIDPARHAREEVQGLAKAINEIANQKNITQLQAAEEFLKKSGVDVTPGTQGGNLAILLAENAARQIAIDQLNQLNAAREVAAHNTTFEKEQVQKLAEKLVDQAKREGTLRDIYMAQSSGRSSALVLVRQEINGIDALVLAQQQLSGATQIATNVAYENARAMEAQAQAAASAAAIMSIAAQQISDALNAATGRQDSAFAARLDALGTGESARTRRLQKQLDNASSGGGGDGGAKQRELANIAEERALLLLKMRLRLLGTNINLERYSGKFLLVAIEAKIAALQREGREQAKINALLDLRYRQSQEITRNEGEGISPFLERRAQENRKLLAEEDDLRRQNQIDALSDRKQVLEDEIALQELANRKRDALRKQDSASNNDALRKQLEASRKADAAALAAKKKALKAEQNAREKAAREALQLVSDSALAETRAAIRGMDTLEELNIVSGRIAGYQRAKATIQALVDGFGLPPSIAAGLLAKINGLIKQFQGQRRDVFGGAALSKPGGAAQPFASGGIIDLKNSNSPFGSNIRHGEEGTEIGVILSHNVAKILQGQKAGVQQVGPFNLYASENPLRDRYAFGKMVEKSVEAALG